MPTEANRLNGAGRVRIHRYPVWQECRCSHCPERQWLAANAGDIQADLLRTKDKLEQDWNSEPSVAALARKRRRSKEKGDSRTTDGHEKQGSGWLKKVPRA